MRARTEKSPLFRAGFCLKKFLEFFKKTVDKQ